MNKEKNSDVKVNILDRDFMISCPESERSEVLAAAAYLNQQMKAIQSSGKIFGIDRCAIMAALNISHELLTVKQGSNDHYSSQIDKIHAKLDDAVETHQEYLL